MRLLIAAGVLLLSTATAQAEQLRLATMNVEFLARPTVHVRFGLALDPREQKPEERAAWTAELRDQRFAEAVGAVADFLATLDADVLALTEAGDRRDVDELLEALADRGRPYAHSAVCECTDTFTRQHVAVLSRFPLTDVLSEIPGRETYLMEPDDPDEDDTGISKGLRVTVTAGEIPIDLYVVHLASERGGSEQDAQRVAQASIVRRNYLPGLEAGRHVVVAGDLNDGRGQPAINRIRGLDDIGEDLIQTGLPRFFAQDKLGTRWTYEFQGERQQIDHVLVSQSLRAASRSISSNVPEGRTGVSDHRPFIVNIDLR